MILIIIASFFIAIFQNNYIPLHCLLRERKSLGNNPFYKRQVVFSDINPRKSEVILVV